MGGQTALNCALACHDGVLEKYGVELIGANAEAIDKAEDREKFKDAMTKIGLGRRASASRTAWTRPGQVQRRVGFPHDHPPSFTLGGTGGGIAYNKEEFRDHLQARPGSLADQRGADRGVAARLERVRDGGGARQGGQLHHHLLDREPRPDGRAHRRLDHRRPGADADRQGIPDHAQRLDRVLREIGVDTGGSNVQFAINPKDGRMIVIEMNPRVSRSSALASKATGFPIAKVAAKLAVGYTLDELRNDITAAQDAGLVRADDRLRGHQDPALRLREVPGPTPLTTQMKSVGEVMAIGRTFQESLQKALRGLPRATACCTMR
jgi:carbamoyl-phosphate synthase large subunit